MSVPVWINGIACLPAVEHEALAAELADCKSDLKATEKQGDAAHEACVQVEARIAQLEADLKDNQECLSRPVRRWRSNIRMSRSLMGRCARCVDTFDDMQRVLRLLGRPVLADACAVAADRSRDLLSPPPETPSLQREPPHCPTCNCGDRDARTLEISVR